MNQKDFFELLSTNYQFVSPEIKKNKLEEFRDNDVVELVNRILNQANQIGASDIHIEPRINDKVYIRLRVEGQMIDLGFLDYKYRENVISRIKVLANMDISEKRKPQDGKLSVLVGDPNVRLNLRVATFPTAGGLEDMVMRLLPNEEPLPLNNIGLHLANLKKMERILNDPYGMIFVCGPTGSGKTTSLHSMLKYLNIPERKIWTAEDPVEITQDGMRQVQIQKFLDYATVLRAFLRGDPDVIMIGEIRDAESATIASEASLTGHLVLSTLHTNSAVESVIRVISMGVNHFTVADAVLGVLAQRLCRTLCSKCKESYVASKEEIVELIKAFSQEMRQTDIFRENPDEFAKSLYQNWVEQYGENGKINLYKPRGCSRCRNGYRGRIGIHELMINSDEIKNAIIARKSSDEIEKIALEQGMFSLKMDGIIKIITGVIDLAQLEIISK